MSIYPTSSPPGSHYLPINDERVFFSETEGIAAQISRRFGSCEENYITRNAAQKRVDTAFHSANFNAIPKVYEQVKDELFQSLEKYKKKLKARITEKELGENITHIFDNWAISCLQKNEKIISRGSFELSEEDWKLGNRDFSAYNCEPRICSDFAFFLLEEEFAFPFLFTLPHSWPKKIETDTIHLLKEWGYELTSSPVAGDLVAYFEITNDNPFKMEMVHTGIWLREQTILSKWGVGDVYEHPMGLVYVGFGSFTYCFHKTYVADLTTKYLNEIKSVAESECSHPAYYSLLSLEECKMVMLNILKKIPHTKKTFERGMYNDEYHEKLREVVLKAIYQFPTDASQTKRQFLADLYHLVSQVAAQVSPSEIYGLGVWPQGSYPLPSSEERVLISEVQRLAGDVSWEIKLSREMHPSYSHQIANKKIDGFTRGLDLSSLPSKYREIAQSFLAESINEYRKGLNVINSGQFYKDMSNLIGSWEDRCMLISGNIKEHPSFSFNIDDFALADMTFSQRKYICMDFAFYLLNEKNAFTCMFQEKNQWPKEFMFDTFSFLERWGYNVTTSPIVGDLVVYFSEDKGVLSQKHVGIWLENGMVLSKWGKGNVYQHPIASVDIEYGPCTFFFHKQFQSELIIKYKEAIASAWEKIGAHPQSCSSLSLEGCKWAIFNVLKEIPNTQRTFERGMYNREYHEKLRQVVLQAIYAFPAYENCKTKQEFLGALYKLVTAVADQVRPSSIYGIPV